MLKQRVLVLAPRFPYPTIGGDRMRILHVCRALSARFTLTLLSLCETEEEMRCEPQDGLFASIHRVHLPRWRSWLNTIGALPGSRPLQLAYYESAAFRRQVLSLAPQHDLIVAHLIRTGQDVAEGECARVPRILEMTDAISMNYRRISETPGHLSLKKLVYSIEQNRLERYERGILPHFNRVWLTSGADRLFLDPQQEHAVEVIANGTDLRPPNPPSPGNEGNVIVFIANMVTVPNQDACQWFLREVFPRVRAVAPEIKFRIVGNATETIRREFARYEGVELTGRIHNIADGVAGAFCAVSPLRAAAGIQNKILEYLALGIPCITSSVGLGGVEARDGHEVLVYHDSSQAVQQILELRARFRIAPTSLRGRAAPH